jgi:NAD(P)-dependent dehydrogenase (short-subunit alcohol dehydrogenase family)
MDLHLKGKTAIVTGGSAGIGLAIARQLAEEGVEFTIPGRNGKKLKEAIASLPGTVRGVEADLATSEGARTLIEQVPETDILVNNLGIYESKAFADITDEGWLRYFEVNQRMAEESEVASMVAYLASPLAAATNGAAVRVEGGILRTIFEFPADRQRDPRFNCLPVL